MRFAIFLENCQVVSASNVEIRKMLIALLLMSPVSCCGLNICLDVSVVFPYVSSPITSCHIIQSYFIIQLNITTSHFADMQIRSNQHNILMTHIISLPIWYQIIPSLFSDQPAHLTMVSSNRLTSKSGESMLMVLPGGWGLLVESKETMETHNGCISIY